jgi:hypothetical protein
LERAIALDADAGVGPADVGGGLVGADVVAAAAVVLVGLEVGAVGAALGEAGVALDLALALEAGGGGVLRGGAGRGALAAVGRGGEQAGLAAVGGVAVAVAPRLLAVELALALPALAERVWDAPRALHPAVPAVAQAAPHVHPAPGVAVARLVTPRTAGLVLRICTKGHTMDINPQPHKNMQVPAKSKLRNFSLPANVMQIMRMTERAPTTLMRRGAMPTDRVGGERSDVDCRQ